MLAIDTNLIVRYLTDDHPTRSSRARALIDSQPVSERGLDFADALHLGKSAHCVGFATFDRKFVTAAQAAGYDGVQEA
ncbi:hypothetical protein NKI79_21725 [Mesorhizobium sp. M0340]|uniref:hypothetical protein n=1 Tax=Mesorhizobium sp. M0340 TaxID=2956939 RepID=UPI00333B14C0